MDSENKAVLLFGICFMAIFLLLAVYTDNPRQGTPKDNTNSINCEQYDLNAVECPLKQKQSIKTVSLDNRSGDTHG